MYEWLKSTEYLQKEKKEKKKKQNQKKKKKGKERILLHFGNQRSNYCFPFLQLQNPRLRTCKYHVQHYTT